MINISPTRGARDCTMETRIYKSYKDFFQRADKRENGVSEEFAAQHPNFKKDNETNIGCWNCHSCTSCIQCISGNYCMNSRYCKDCTNCNNCKNIYNCVDCFYCQDCASCNNCHWCFNCACCRDDKWCGYLRLRLWEDCYNIS